MTRLRFPIRRFLLVLTTWPLICATSSALTVFLREAEALSTANDVILLHAAAGWIAALIWFSLDRLLIRRFERLSARFVLSFTLLIGLTVGVSAGLFAIQFWVYFSQWHEPLTSRIGLYQAIFTSASAIYQYAVLGARHLIVLALPAAALFASIAARHPHIEAREPIR
ncbi:hypothetical protein [Notoacmeibacter sp. MSK16QG-6]|uniref:hypothetical protein n=1 Tax=Notoacmeibacter sp. MSK16QG-6 TaxID=2957982 RepID=UPI00209F3D0F|nr:hypothetical protein [Notoacmeibacter sp. MSK16QG-6]MCP1199444.1 hypothetical protein [Notoacmeibacter sp. MSK16QG-6]